MSKGFSDLESRVSTLEYQIRIATSDAAEARVLARAADRDVSNVHAAVNANQHLINALRQTQLEQGTKLDALDTKVGALDTKVEALDTKVDNLAGVVAEQGLVQAEHSARLADHTATLREHSATLAEHTATLAEHGRKLDALDKKIDSRFDEVVSLLRQQRTDS